MLLTIFEKMLNFERRTRLQDPLKGFTGQWRSDSLAAQEGAAMSNLFWLSAA